MKLKLNPAYLTLALALFALWGLRRLGMDETTADAITTALMLALGASPSALPETARRVGPIALVLLATVGCGQLEIAATRSSHLDIRVPAPHHVEATVDGVVRYRQSGPMPLELRAPPGTCLRSGPDGVLRPCP